MDADLKKPLILILFIMFSALAGVWFIEVKDSGFIDVSREYAGGVMLSIEGVKVFAEIADEKDEWEKGLSGRDKLPPNRAMLFVFPTSDYYAIWMKDMNFPIDVFWIDENGYIVDIWKHAMPDSYPYVYEPQSKAKYVLETIADFAEEHGIEVGDKVYNLPK